MSLVTLRACFATHFPERTMLAHAPTGTIEQISGGEENAYADLGQSCSVA
jgi:hypothetical protein